MSDYDDEEIKAFLRDRAERLRKSKRNLDYRCSSCGRQVGRENLKAKRVQFKDMGLGGRVDQTRVVAWLCMINQEDGSPSCLHSDSDWSRERYVDAPGMKRSNDE